MGKHVAPIGQNLCQAVAQKVDVAISIFLSSEYHSSDFLSPDNFYLIFKPSRQSADSCQVVNYLFIRILPRKTRWSDSFLKILDFTKNQRYGQGFAPFVSEYRIWNYVTVKVRMRQMSWHIALRRGSFTHVISHLTLVPLVFRLLVALGITYNDGAERNKIGRKTEELAHRLAALFRRIGAGPDST